MSGHALQPVEVTWGPRDQTGCQELHVIQRCSCGDGCELKCPVDTQGGNAAIKGMVERDLIPWVVERMEGHVAAYAAEGSVIKA